MYAAKVIADSIPRPWAHTPNTRLTTLELTFPRFILAEFNTHRQFCLAGDAVLEFDLPSGGKNTDYRVHRMRVDAFVDKWLNGARRTGANPKRECDLSVIDLEQTYTAREVSDLLKYEYSMVNKAARDGAVQATKPHGSRVWHMTGAAVVAWRAAAPAHTRFGMQDRLRGMRIRQLNEITGDIQHSTVTDAWESGTKPVYQVTAGAFSVAGSADHRVYTTEGWKTIGELSVGDLLVVQKFGKRDEEHADPLRLKKIDGKWRSTWQRDVRQTMVSEDPMCRTCRAAKGVDTHHIVPVHTCPERAFDLTNVTLLCKQCHDEAHSTQGWQGGMYLYGAAVPVTAVVLRGEEPTYDLAIAGQFPNFLANGVVVHNSRNSASSRAIPVEKRIAEVLRDPFIPEAFAANKRGMQAGDLLDAFDNETVRNVWLRGRDAMAGVAQFFVDYDVHKQWANRPLELFAFHTVVVSSCYWDNWDALRISSMAQPEIATIAKMAYEARKASTPRELSVGDWHLPYVQDDELATRDFDKLVKVSTARCARVSYLTQNNIRDHAEDIKLYERLAAPGHMSPFEHPARVGSWGPLAEGWPEDADIPRGVYNAEKLAGNFSPPWIQHRKELPGEAVAKREEGYYEF